MNSIRYIGGMVLLLLFCTIQCKKEPVPALFEIESILQANFQAGLNTVETHYIESPRISSTYRAQLKTRNLDSEIVKAIRPQAFILTSLDNQTRFNFIENVSVRMFSPERDIEKEIAFLEFVPLNTKTNLRLFPSLVDVKEFFEEESFQIRIRFRVRSFLQQSLDARIDMVFQAE